MKKKLEILQKVVRFFFFFLIKIKQATFHRGKTRSSLAHAWELGTKITVRYKSESTVFSLISLPLFGTSDPR